MICPTELLKLKITRTGLVFGLRLASSRALDQVSFFIGCDGYLSCKPLTHNIPAQVQQSAVIIFDDSSLTRFFKVARDRSSKRRAWDGEFYKYDEFKQWYEEFAMDCWVAADTVRRAWDGSCSGQRVESFSLARALRIRPESSSLYRCRLSCVREYVSV